MSEVLIIQPLFRMKKWLVGWLIFLSVGSFSQTRFEEINANLKGVMNSTVSWSDIDNDGDSDLMISGLVVNGADHQIITHFYHNDRNNRFVNVPLNIAGVFNASVDWADFDNDGDDDLLISGLTSGNKPITRVYRNERTWRFTDMRLPLPGVKSGFSAWLDFDRNGSPDIVVFGTNEANEPVALSFRNTGVNQFTPVAMGLIPLSVCTGVVADFNNDGFSDILATGRLASGTLGTILFYNDCGQQFVPFATAIPGLIFASVAWADFDNNGTADVIVTGQTDNGQKMSAVYRNRGTGNFEATASVLPGVRSGSVSCADFNNDGLADILITGETETGNIITQLFRNSHNFEFTPEEQLFHGVYLSDVAWSDFNVNNAPGFAIAGLDEKFNFVARIYRNQTPPACRRQEEPIIATPTPPRNELPVLHTDPFIFSRMPDTRKARNYHYVYSSCYCDPISREYDGRLNVFISDVFYFAGEYKLQESYNQQLVINKPNWPGIDMGYLSVGLSSRSEAETSRRLVIEKYEAAGFKVHQLDW